MFELEQINNTLIQVKTPRRGGGRAPPSEGKGTIRAMASQRLIPKNQVLLLMVLAY